MSLSISQAVGQNAPNLKPDVKLVQDLLKKTGLSPGPSDGICGARTLAAILAFQARLLSKPDGRIDPNQTTWRHLTGQHKTAPVHAQWDGDSSRWSQEKKLDSMNATLRAKVRMLVDALAKRGFRPKIFFGWRSVKVQRELYDKGRSKVLFSFHNAQHPDGTPNAYAADIIDERYGWEDKPETKAFWKALGEEAKKLGLYWGGDWTSFRDWAHVQLHPNAKLAEVKRESGL